MLAAHEMFKNANRVSRAEKALILGFMAGARGRLKVLHLWCCVVNSRDIYQV